tara:strand:- start:1150 stop:1545 length:396 start_codon:yes stop_codon:yes gene_type:complete
MKCISIAIISVFLSACSTYEPIGAPEVSVSEIDIPSTEIPITIAAPEISIDDYLPPSPEADRGFHNICGGVYWEEAEFESEFVFQMFQPETVYFTPIDAIVADYGHTKPKEYIYFRLVPNTLNKSKQSERF